MNELIEAARGKTVDEVEQEIAASQKAPQIPDARVLAEYLVSQAGG